MFNRSSEVSRFHLQQQPPRPHIVSFYGRRLILDGDPLKANMRFHQPFDDATLRDLRAKLKERKMLHLQPGQQTPQDHLSGLILWGFSDDNILGYLHDLPEERRKELNRRNINGTLPIGVALFCGRVTLARYLIQKFDVDAKDLNLFHELFFSPCDFDKEKALHRMITLGARLDLQDRSGRTPFMQILKVVRILGVFDERVLRAFLIEGHTAHLSLSDKKGNTILHYGVEILSVAFLRKLLAIPEVREIVNKRNDEGIDPISLVEENSEKMHLLMEAKGL